MNSALPRQRVCHRLLPVTTIYELQNLADELTVVAPPPPPPVTLNNIVADSGKWVIRAIGGGSYALRVEYETTNGEKVITRVEEEAFGFPATLRTALRFALQIANAHRLYWQPIY